MARAFVIRVTNALCAGFVLGCGSANGHATPEGGSADTCPVSCLYQYQDVTICNELAPTVQSGPWLENCLDLTSCDNADLFPFSPGDPLTSCTTTRRLRYVQDHLGVCQGQSTGEPWGEGDDGGSDAGKGDGAKCAGHEECLSGNCISTDGQNFVCADACDASSCSKHFACLGGYCFPECMHL